jgi:hypothetical protein
LLIQAAQWPRVELSRRMETVPSQQLVAAEDLGGTLQYHVRGLTHGSHW